MDWNALQEFGFIWALILLNGFFAGAEIAILTARRARLKSMADEGDSGAKLALRLANDADQFLPTVQVGITLVATFAAAFGGASVAGNVQAVLKTCGVAWVQEHAETLSLTLVVFGIAFLSLIFGELAPKRIALQHAESWARIVAWPMSLLQRIATPAVWFLRFVTSIVLALVGQKSSDQPGVALEDIQHLIDAGREAGVLHMAEGRVASGALRLGDRKVKEIMRPRIDIDALDIDTPADEVVGAMAMSGFSRVPVCEGNIDHIAGFVYIKDVLLHLHLNRPIDLRRLIRPALFVPPSVTVTRLLELFQQQRTQIAIVLDEYGGTEGMVTLEDVFEILVGDIHDERRQDHEQQLVRREDGSWLADASVSLHDVEVTLEIPRWLDPPPRGVSTISGVVLSVLRRPPRIGDSVVWNDLKIEVVDMDGPRIDRLLIQAEMNRAAEAEASEA